MTDVRRSQNVRDVCGPEAPSAGRDGFSNVSFLRPEEARARCFRYLMDNLRAPRRVTTADRARLKPGGPRGAPVRRPAATLVARPALRAGIQGVPGTVRPPRVQEMEVEMSRGPDPETEEEMLGRMTNGMTDPGDAGDQPPEDRVLEQSPPEVQHHSVQMNGGEDPEALEMS
jgi:hypothetical protein